MKILQINKYHYVRGGSDSVYFNTSKLLSTNGHQVVHFAMKFEQNNESPYSEYFAENNDNSQRSTGQQLANLKSFFLNDNAAEKIEKLIKKEKPDIAHLHIFYGSLTSSILRVLQLNKIPTVVSVHDYKFICPAYLLLDGKNKICTKCEGRNFIHAAINSCVKNNVFYSTVFAMESYFRDWIYPIESMFNKLIFVSKFSKNIHAKYKPDLNKKSVHLYNFDPNLTKKDPSDIKGTYFLYAGRLSKEKGLNTLIAAFNELPHLRLKIVGGGDELEKLQLLSGPNIEFLGFKRGDELEETILGSSFVIVPSEWFENNPMAIIESYSLGKPVIAANIGGIPEIVIDEKTGFLFQSGNVLDLVSKIKLANIVSDIEYKCMSQNSVHFAVKNFNPDLHYNELMKIYKDTIESSSFKKS